MIGALTSEVAGVTIGLDTLMKVGAAVVVCVAEFRFDITCVERTATKTVSVRAMTSARYVITFKFFRVILLLSSGVINASPLLVCDQ